LKQNLAKRGGKEPEEGKQQNKPEILKVAEEEIAHGITKRRRGYSIETGKNGPTKKKEHWEQNRHGRRNQQKKYDGRDPTQLPQR